MRQRYLEDVKGQLAACPGKKEMLELLVDYAKENPSFPESQKTEANLVKGCNATVYMTTSKDRKGFHFSGWSNSFIISGFIRILTQALDGLNAAELDVAKETVTRFLKETKLDVAQLQSRANTFGNIFLKIEEQVKAYPEA